MASLPAAQFIKFLSAYLPHINNEAQFDEHVTKVARENKVEPFKFVFDKQSEYKRHIRLAMLERKSRVFLISGQAGDGKTHFIHELCTDKSVFNLSEDTWLSLLQNNYDYLAVDASGAIDPSSKETSPKAIKRGVKCIHLLEQKVKLYLVTDLTSITHERDKKDFFMFIEHIAKQSLDHKNATITAARTAAMSALGALQANVNTDSAATAGSILSGDLRHTAKAASGAVKVGGAGASDSISGASAAGAGYGGASANDSAAGAGGSGGAGAGAGDDTWVSMVLVAGNNGRILSIFNDYEGYAQSGDSAVFSEIVKVTKSLEKHMILKQVFYSDFIELMPMSECLDRKAVEGIFATILNDSNWDRCKYCSIAAQCPILANRNALNHENVMRHFADLFELAKDDHMHFTVRNLIVVVCNAILGNQDKGKDRFYTCKKASNDVDKRFDASNGYSGDRRSSPFDNLLGINLSSTLRQKVDVELGEDGASNTLSTPPIFVQLASFSLGDISHKIIDDFILRGAFDEESEAGHKLSALLSSYDAADLKLKLRDCLEKLQEPTDNDDEKENSTLSNSVKSLLASIRRVLFFSADEAADQASLSLSGFSTYSLSSLNYAKSYLSFKHTVRYTHDLIEDVVAERTLKQLLDGLNRVFTSLSVFNTNKQIYITSNNIINPAAYCIVPDEHRYIIKFDGTKGTFQDVIRIVRSGLINDVKDLPALAYYPPADTWQSLSDQDSARSSTRLSCTNPSSLLDRHTLDALTKFIKADQNFQYFCRGKGLALNDLSTDELLDAYYDLLKLLTQDNAQSLPQHAIYSCLSTILGHNGSAACANAAAVAYASGLASDASKDQSAIASGHELAKDQGHRVDEVAKLVAYPESSKVNVLAKDQGHRVDEVAKLVAYPESSKVNELYPIAAERLILTPRIFDYLMSLGAGLSSVSFSDECFEEISAFKTRIDAFKAKTYKSSTPSGQPSIAKLLFCDVDDEGKIKYR